VRKRTLTTLLGAALAAIVAAAPAQARLVYVKGAASLNPTVFVADDDGANPRELGPGHSPTISDNGRWVAWVKPASPDRVVIRRADRRFSARRVGAAGRIGELRFSPNSRLLASVRGRNLYVHDIRSRKETRAARGHIRGFSFSPDSRMLVYGRANRSDFGAPADLYTARADGDERERITRDRRSLNPLWSPEGIVHDRQRWRAGNAPAYNLFEVQPDGGDFRRITRLRIPSLVSGLIPLEANTTGSRLLANFVGQNTMVGFRVNPSSGSVKSLDSDFENGFVAADLSDDGRTVLGHTGGPDPFRRHNIVTMPYRGGEQTVLVRRAMSPDWSR
jgi:dipeptidyl aminopeptidase/acylaminoacyl peptidase